MKRTGFDERRDQQIAGDYLGSHMACNSCGAMTDKETLTNYGARCGRCFQGYLLQGQPVRRLTPDERRAVVARVRQALGRMAGGISVGHAAGVAARLRTLQGSGMRLTDSQKWVLNCCEEKSA
jgi:hypothetical protein